MKRLLTLTTLLTSMLALTACAAPTPSPSPTSTATLTPSPTATKSPTYTPPPPPTATLPYQPLEGSTYREVARYDLKGQVEKNELSPDGSMLAVLTDDGVFLYDSDTLELRWRRQERDIGIASSIAWTPNNELLFIRKDSPNYLLDPEDGSILEETDDVFDKGHSTPSPNGKYSFTYHVDRYECLIYSAHPRRLLFTLSGSYQSSFPVWMPDGEHIIFYPGEGSFEIWNVERGEIVQELENLYKWDRGWVSGFTPDEQYFVHTGSIYDPQQDQYLFRAIAWNLSTGEPIPVDILDGSPSKHGWQLNENIITFYNGMVIRINDSIAEMTTLHGSTFYPQDVYKRPDGLLVVLRDAILRYDNHFNLISSTIGHTTGFGNTNKTLSPDGQMLAIGTATRFYVWDIGQNELVTTATELEGYIHARARWSADSKTLAISNHKHQISLWDTNTRSIQKTIDVGNHVCDLAWVDQSTLALALTEEPAPTTPGGGCWMEFLAILDIETEQIIYREPQFVHFLDFISLYDQRHIAFHQWTDLEAEEITSTLVIWDSQTNQRIYSTEVENLADVRRLQHTPGVIIAETGIFRVIDLETGTESTIKLNTDREPPFSFYLLGDYILEYDFDNTAINWYDLDGNLLETGEIDFERYWVENQVVLVDGRVFGIVNPYSRWSPGVALIELFPPEQ